MSQESRLDAKLDRAELPAVAAELAERVERLVAERPAEQGASLLGQEHFAAGTKLKLLRYYYRGLSRRYPARVDSHRLNACDMILHDGGTWASSTSP